MHNNGIGPVYRLAARRISVDLDAGVAAEYSGWGLLAAGF